MARAAANRGRLGDPTRCPVGRDADSVQRGREGEKAGETAKVREKKKKGGALVTERVTASSMVARPRTYVLLRSW